jgi:LPPG:FO 2-phospho-L-lactate transferase
MNIVVLSGGVGGARFLSGLAELLEPHELTIIGNVGDDVEILGLHVSPDLDTVLYTLAGLADPERGWGRADETWAALDTVAALGGETWFRLGDRDLGFHLVRTELLRAGQPLSDVTVHLARALGVEQTLLPATNDNLRTFIHTPSGTFTFQTWFVARAHADQVDGVDYRGSAEATPAPGVVEAIVAADAIVITPSNPFTSIGPILAVNEIRDALLRRNAPCIAISPLIAGRAVQGPAADMLARLCGGVTPMHLARCYDGLIDALLYDTADGRTSLPLGVRPVTGDILMLGRSGSRRVATTALEAVC